VQCIWGTSKLVELSFQSSHCIIYELMPYRLAREVYRHYQELKLRQEQAFISERFYEIVIRAHVLTR